MVVLWTAGALVVLLVLILRTRRRTYYVALERMSDTWIREHAGDPLPDHLQ